MLSSLSKGKGDDPIHRHLGQGRAKNRPGSVNSSKSKCNERGDGDDTLNNQHNNLSVNQLKALLKSKGLPISGRKSVLIDRLKIGYSGGGLTTTTNKPKAWQYSDAKKDLKMALLDPMSQIHWMSVDKIRNSDDRYKQYPNFTKYYKDLMKRVKAEKIHVKQDNIAAKRYITDNPRLSNLNKRGYPHWDTHVAKSMLEIDIAKKKNESMPPRQLWTTRDAYKEFPADIFAKRVYAEVSKQKAAAFWAHKRNKKGWQSAWKMLR